MTKQEKEKIITEFKKRMAEKPVIVNGSGWSIPLDEYMEQEKWARPRVTAVPNELSKKEYKLDNENMGILNKESVFETDLWYLRNHAGFDLSVRNGRRIRR